MNDYFAFLDRIIDDGIAAVREDYKHRKPFWIEGGVAGFEACRDKTIVELAQLLERARRVGQRAHRQRTDVARYWRIRAYESEVEWVCNVVSAALWNSGQSTIITPTARGVMKAAEILGVRQEGVLPS
jgi:hypothetical protein